MDNSPEVVLQPGLSASDVLYATLRATAAAFPDALATAPIPADGSAFRTAYVQALPHFEALRISHPERIAIAQHLCTTLQDKLLWQHEESMVPLNNALEQSVPPLNLQSHKYSGDAGWAPNFVYQGKRWEVGEFAELGALLHDRNVITRTASQALAWIGAHTQSTGCLDLTGRKIAMLGANAEMAPTRLWLEAGAHVLWLDTAPPPKSWLDVPGMSGRLTWPTGNADLLRQPREVLATLIAFADGDPLDLGLYAYAPGKARELRLTATMNALVNALPTALVRSVTILVSPTTPAHLSAQDLQAAQRRRTSRPAWEAVFEVLGLLGRKGNAVVEHNEAAVAGMLVGTQGASYQAAQYLGKVLMADTWAAVGQLGVDEPTPLRVSANTAAITRTRSLDHPVFAAAFGGAGAFGVETMTPRQSRRLNGLLAVHDWLCPDRPIPGVVRVHGGIHTLPYPLDVALRVAAAIGFARSPRLLGGLFKAG